MTKLRFGDENHWCKLWSRDCGVKELSRNLALQERLLVNADFLVVVEEDVHCGGPLGGQQCALHRGHAEHRGRVGLGRLRTRQ